MSQAQLLPTSNFSLPPLTYKGQPVVTTEMLAQAYGCTSTNIHDNYRKNKERFVEGKHFYLLTSQELKEFRLQPESFLLQISPKTRNLTVWLERGAARHAKMLNTDKAWDVFEMLEETFFRVAQTPSASTSTLTPDQQCTLKNMVDNLASKGIKHVAIWSRFNNHFRIAKYNQLPPSKMSEAISYLMNFEVGKKQAALPASGQLDLAGPAGTQAELDSMLIELHNKLEEAKEIESRFCSCLRKATDYRSEFFLKKGPIMTNALPINNMLWYSLNSLLSAIAKNSATVVAISRLNLT